MEKTGSQIVIDAELKMIGVMFIRFDKYLHKRFKHASELCEFKKEGACGHPLCPNSNWSCRLINCPLVKKGRVIK